jgi:aspartate ammonia-lyase
MDDDRRVRSETDLLGEREVPGARLWGVHTLRALENAGAGSARVPLSLIRALVQVKKACCLANKELGCLDARKAEAILSAADEALSGRWDEEFPLPAVQGGAGTSTNMNVNEVLAGRASELLGGRRADRALVRPIDDVNLHQSTNDVYPTALKVAAIQGFRNLASAIAALQGALQRREAAFARVLKIGRTELVEAVPMTLGMEFSAFAEAVGRDRWRTFKCEERLRTVNLGGTALGTGLTAPRDFIFLAVERLREVTGLPLARAENLVAETAGADVFVEVSGILKAHAATLLKMSSDLRLLALLGEIRLPPLQAGSSVMPGKVNPVLLELSSQVGLKVMANDLLVTEAVSRAHLQINELLPLLAAALLESLEMLAELDGRLAAHIDGITADEERCREALWKSPGLITAFVYKLGYEGASRLAEEFQERGGKDCHAFLVEKVGAQVVAETLSPENLTALGHKRQEGAPR